MSRFKPKGAAVAEPGELPQVLAQAPDTRPAPPSPPRSDSPLPATALAATATEKLAFGLNMLFLFFVNSRLTELFPFTASLHPMVILSIVAGLVAVLNGTLWKTLTSRLGVLFLALTVWFSLTIPLSVWRGGSVGVFRGEWLTSVAMFFLVASVTVNSQQALKAIRVSAYALLASGLVALTHGVVVEGRLLMSSEGTFANPNYLAAAMCTGALLWWFILRNPKEGGVSRSIAIGAAAISVVVIIRTGSRGALLALLVTVPFLVMQYSFVSRLRIGAGLACLGLLGFMVAPGLAVKRLTFLFEPDQPAASEMELRVQESAEDSTQSRLSLLKRSLEITGLHPLLGVGIGMFMVAENQLAQSEGVPSMWHETHNTYTQISSETGIPGLILFVATLITSWRAMGALRRDPRLALHPNGQEIQTAATALWLIQLNTMIYALFAHFGYSYTIPIISGLIFALSRGASRELERTPAQ